MIRFGHIVHIVFVIISFLCSCYGSAAQPHARPTILTDSKIISGAGPATLYPTRVDSTGISGASAPWVLWHWVQASVSREGITADLEAMKEAGIGGAYLMSIKGPADPPLMDPPVEQLSDVWWDMVRFAFSEADRLGLKLGMHASDGFAVAGGPWITAELSMQKVVWTETQVESNQDMVLPRPAAMEGYYKDIAVLAFPALEGSNLSTHSVVPKVTTSKAGEDAQFLVRNDNTENFRSNDPCWIQYSFDKPFTCRSITIRTNGNNYQAHRLIIEVSDDGNTFRSLGRLQPPRHGWQDTDAPVTHAIIPTTARFFRFRYDKSGSEPGAEDLDAAKWKASLKVCGITLSSAPRLHQYEGKTGAVWRISERTTSAQLPDDVCIPKDRIVDVTRYLDINGRLTWKAPPGKWTILRIGHTSTGHTNYTGGAGKGLECDKFNPEAVKIQFDHWFGEAVQRVGPALASRVLKVFFVDSWECGSQNWSPVFREEFKKRRGYDLLTYLPAMAGIPVENAAVSERFLYDVRQTIAELVHDNFYGTLQDLAHRTGCSVAAENVSPTMTSDGMLHFNAVDVPMGEFWLRSPTHDKPNDMLDAISGAHIYGKPVIQAEAFTQLRMAWDEHPAMLKTLADRNFALGINRFVYHVFAHNPWPERKPGMTLDGVGLYFQRNQTWWKPGRAWVAYTQRCQEILQRGVPVVDLAVFTGEEIPRRAVLPDRLVSTLPGIFGKEVVNSEARRLANHGEPLREEPDGVRHAANIADPRDWIDPLHGYAFDSFNKDALLRLAKVRNGRIELPGRASYAMLVIPGSRAMNPQGNLMSPEVASRLVQLVKEGATILISETPDHAPGLESFPQADTIVRQMSHELCGGIFEKKGNVAIKQLGKGRVIRGPYHEASFQPIGLDRDVMIHEASGNHAPAIAWTHRRTEAEDIYFIANQKNVTRTIDVSLRGSGRVPVFYDPLSNETWQANEWKVEGGRTVVSIKLDPNASLFVMLKTLAAAEENDGRGTNWVEPEVIQSITGTWKVMFNPEHGGPKDPVSFDALTDWSKHTQFGIRHYSGTAQYSTTFRWKVKKNAHSRAWLDLGHVANIADVYVNGISCGVAWTPPYRVEITKALKRGENDLVIEVTNTWANRLIGDHTLPEDERVTRTTAPYRLEGKPLLEAGLMGPVRVVGDSM